MKKKLVVQKLRENTVCETCGSRRCVYSNKAIGQKDGPTERKFDPVPQFLEKTYICGINIPFKDGFYVKEALGCRDFIESQYYMP